MQYSLKLFLSAFFALSLSAVAHSAPLCQSTLLRPDTNMLIFAESQAENALRNLDLIFSAYRFKKTNLEKNELAHNAAMLMNELADGVVAFQIEKMSPLRHPEDARFMQKISSDIANGLADIAHVQKSSLLKALSVRLRARLEAPAPKAPIGFMKHSSGKENPIAIKFAPKFGVLEPNYDLPYGATSIHQDLAPSQSKLPSIGFIQQKDATKTLIASPMKSIGFIQSTKFVDDHFLYTIEISSVSGDFVLIKNPIN